MSLSGPISLHLPFDSAAGKAIPEIRKPRLRTHRYHSPALKKKKKKAQSIQETCRNMSCSDLGGLDPSDRKLTTTNDSSKISHSQRLLNFGG